jgi:hypothetical protein
VATLIGSALGFAQSQDQRIENLTRTYHVEMGHYRETVQVIEIGYKCGFLEQLQANVAVLQLLSDMQRLVLQYDPISAPDANLKAVVDHEVQVGRQKATQAYCDGLKRDPEAIVALQKEVEALAR